jgi:hypothetical protein
MGIMATHEDMVLGGRHEYKQRRHRDLVGLLRTACAEADGW